MKKLKRILTNKKSKIMNEIFGIITLISATLMSLVGLPLQIHKIYKQKNIGLHFLLVFPTFIVYCARGMYALTNEHGIIWYTFIPDTIGTLCSFIIILQFFYYRKKN